MFNFFSLFNHRKSENSTQSAVFEEKDCLIPVQVWPTVQSLKKDLRTVIQLQRSMLPESLYDFCKDQAFRINNASAEFVVASVVTCAASLIGTSCKIAPKKSDKNWVVSQAIWGLIVGDPSRNKSAALGIGHRLIKFAQREVIDRRKDACEQSDTDVKTIRQHRRNVVVQDCTPEALVLHLQENPNGSIVIRDEIYGWLSKLQRDEHVHERALYTEGFAGNNEFLQKRVSRETVLLEDFFVCVLGCIQPDRLKPLLKARASGESHDGFFERFQMIIYDCTPSCYTDLQADQKLLNKMQHIFCCLASLYENGVNTTFNFSTEAQNLWDCWASRQCDLTQHADISDQAVLGKYPSLVAKLSMIFQLFSEAELVFEHTRFVPSAEVGLRSLQMAIELSSLLLSHNRRIQDVFADETEIRPAELLLKNLHKLPDRFSFRDLYRKKWRGLSQHDDCQSALNILEQHGYIRSNTIDGCNGRSLIRYEVHPDYRAKKQDDIA